ncbi:C2 domain-containing protein [Cocos nucifera]|uniref:C2 domain-containing protein n=1 Tax=Cocos nucifera TaxID=13894 RepID=A0A8K0MTK7_COCNU|nr:C2 domain-containing protein [Cocos nucifera]
MASRTLELTLISAKDLNDVNVFSKMDVYAVAFIAGDQRSRHRTAADKDGGTSPSWYATLRFAVPAAASLVLHVLLRSERALGDRDIGEVHILLKELVDAAAAASGDKSGHIVSCQVRKPSSGKPKGVLNLSNKFVDAPAAPPVFPCSFPANENKSADVPTAYPAVPPYPPPGAYPPQLSRHGDPAGTSTGHPPPGKGGKESNASEPVTAYPPPAPAYPASWAYPAPPAGYPPYGYPPAMPPAGYG